MNGEPDSCLVQLEQGSWLKWHGVSGSQDAPVRAEPRLAAVLRQARVLGGADIALGSPGNRGAHRDSARHLVPDDAIPRADVRAG
jgi:hypothetical protein